MLDIRITAQHSNRLNDHESPWYDAELDGSHKLSLRDEDGWADLWSYEPGVWDGMFRLGEPAVCLPNWVPLVEFEY